MTKEQVDELLQKSESLYQKYQASELTLALAASGRIALRLTKLQEKINQLRDKREDLRLAECRVRDEINRLRSTRPDLVALEVEYFESRQLIWTEFKKLRKAASVSNQPSSIEN